MSTTRGEPPVLMASEENVTPMTLWLVCCVTRNEPRKRCLAERVELLVPLFEGEFSGLIKTLNSGDQEGLGIEPVSPASVRASVP